nr:hypothetical protein [Paenarthrobacter ureafaciens]
MLFDSKESIGGCRKFPATKVARKQAAERGPRVSNPQEPNGQGDVPRNPDPAGPYPPPSGNPAQSGTPPQWQQPPSYAAPQGSPAGGAPNYGSPNPYPKQGQGQGQYPPQPGQYPPGQYGQPSTPPAKKRKTLWIVLGIVAGVIVLAVVGVLVLVNVVGNATSKARGLADEFTKLVVAGDTEEAYDDYLHQALKDELDKQSFIDGIASLELDNSCKPNYNSVSVNNNNGNNKADLSGTLQCDGKTINLHYVFEGTNDLKMSSIRLRP